MSKKRIKAACIKPQRGSTGMFYIGSDRHRDEAVFTLFQDDIPALIEQMACDFIACPSDHATDCMAYAFARAGLKARKKTK